MVDLQAAVNAYANLHAYVANEEALGHLRPAAEQLENVARRLAAGHLELFIPDPSLRASSIPTRELAAGIMARISEIPGVDGTESAELRKAYAHLSAAVVYTIMHVIFRDYPDLVPRDLAAGVGNE